ncbi:MAG: hypothetical protein RL657_2878 [Pseudomonadota bacterium]|jgi:D-arabinose 1-dehydrogenase-like Zn-dependent alcohol dehydrogenase
MISYDITEWGKPLQQSLREPPQPAGAELLIRLKYCGICHSDVHIRDGYFDLGGGKKFHMSERGMKLPVTMGHEPFGTVVAAGPGAFGAPLGQDVLIYPWTGCGTCPRCQEGMDNWCPTPRFLGIQRPGGYAQYMIVPDARYLIDAAGIEPEFAPILACSGLTTYSAARKLMPCDPQDWIVVMGAGGLGLMAVAMLKALGHQHIAVCDIDERKWPAALALGASEVINPAQAGAAAQLAGLVGGVWGVLDLVGAASTAQLGLASLRKGGRYVVVGLYGGEIPISLVPMAQRAITLQGSYVGSPQELREVVALAQSGRLQRIPTAVCPANEISSQLDRLKTGEVVGRMVARWD